MRNPSSRSLAADTSYSPSTSLSKSRSSSRSSTTRIRFFFGLGARIKISLVISIRLLISYFSSLLAVEHLDDRRSEFAVHCSPLSSHPALNQTQTLATLDIARSKRRLGRRLFRRASLRRLPRGFLDRLLRGGSLRRLTLRRRRRFDSRRSDLIGRALRMPSQELGQRQSRQTDGLRIGFGDRQVVSSLTAHYHSAASRRTIWDYCRNQKRAFCQFAFRAVLQLLRVVIIAGRITRLVSPPETKLDQLCLDLLSLLFSHLLASSPLRLSLRGLLRRGLLQSSRSRRRRTPSDIQLFNQRR